MANWNNPTLTSTYTNFVTEVKDRDVEAAVWFEGMSPTNLPTNAKRLNTSTGRFEKWNGSAWVDAVATFTFPALSVAGVSTFTGVATFTANPVMNGGTANGVPYLNGSKVLTTGSALTYNGTGLGVGVSSASFALDVGGADGTNIALRSTGTSAARFRAYVNGSESGVIGFLNGGGQFFEVAGSEQMRLTSTGLGIGTSSPSSKLEVLNAGDAIITLTGNTASGNVASLDFKRNTGTVNAAIRSQSVGANDAGEIYFSTRPNAGSLTERMRLDASGNFGLAVTPAAWDTSTKAFQIQRGSLAVISNLNLALSLNTYFDGTNDRALTGGGQKATTYVQSDGKHTWFTAPAVATNAIQTWTQALNLDASANLISGGTGYWQLPNGTTAQRPGTASAGMIRFNATLTRYEGHNGTAWSSIGGGATGGGSDDIFYENGQTVTNSYTITTNKNAISAGPIVIASGVTVTIPAGSNWVVV